MSYRRALPVGSGTVALRLLALEPGWNQNQRAKQDLSHRVDREADQTVHRAQRSERQRLAAAPSEAGREGRGAGGPRDDDARILKRLKEHLAHVRQLRRHGQARWSA